MTIWHLVFAVLSAVAVLSASVVVAPRNPVYSVLSLVVCLFSLAGHYILLGAPFLAIVHIIVYASAIMVLFLFVNMLLNLNRATDVAQSLRVQTAAAVTAGLMLVSLAVAVRGVDVPVSSTLTVGTVGRLGQVLFDQYMVPFELSSVLFLAAIVGVVVVSKKRLRDENL